MDGPLLVLAGAGTGKTRVLSCRVANILATRRAWPSQIMAVTFTNKAAREMRERMERLIGGGAEDIWLGTFHALAARMLRQHAEMIGLKPNFSILNTDDQLRLIKQIIQAESIDEKRLPPRALAAIFDRWKDKGLTPEKLSAADHGAAEGLGPKLYAFYQDRLRQLNACDFGDLLLHIISIFTSHDDIAARWQEKFKYILVDEYQDSNSAQYLWLRLLARKHRNICCVGDDDQSIYGWRGAEVGNILRFERDYPGAQIIRLERNYRSTPHILAAASGVIAHNQGRLGKTLWTDATEGEKIRILSVWDHDAEAREVGEEIEALQRRGEPLSSMAILVRAGHQTRAFEERFLTMGVKYRVVGGLRFYERQEIRDAVAYLRLIHQPDDDLAFERIVNLPKRGFGETSLTTLGRLARAQRISLSAAAAALAETDELKPKTRKTLADFMAQITRWRDAAETMEPADLMDLVLEESGYLAMWQADRTPEAPGRIENLKELIEALTSYANLGEFIEHVSLVMDAEGGGDEDMVSLMTLHGAKGLEFDTVFLPGWEEGLFPSQRALDEGGLSALEEERRLAYVGITRARKRCIIAHAQNRRVFNQWSVSIPSRFIEELPDAHVERIAPQGYSSSMADSAAFDYRRWGDTRVRDSEAPTAIRPGSYKPGQRVFHMKFGYGRVQTVDGSRLTVVFDKAGEKKVMDNFVEPA